MMKKYFLAVSVVAAFAFAAIVQASPAPASQAASAAAPTANPLASFTRHATEDSAKNLVGAAEEMPADKYSYQPSPAQITFAHLIFHSVRANYGLCAKISGATAPDAKVAETDGKDKLVAALKASYDFCTSSLEKVDDSNLGEVIPLYGTVKASRAGAMVTLSVEYADHYTQAAMYLRLNGLLPPTAKKDK
jgi:DinB family protein